jgi:hypothetical protein
MLPAKWSGRYAHAPKHESRTMPKLFWLGLAVFLLGEAPLLVIVIAAQLGLWPDPNPNPIGPGLLSFVTFWPGLVLMLLGFLRRRRPV